MPTSQSSWSINNVRAGVLPPRYAVSMRESFEGFVSPALVPEVRILDVGSGRYPSFDRTSLPRLTHYVGLDVSALELEHAPEGAYDEIEVNDVATHIPTFDGAFDLIVSWHVLEHVATLEVALNNMRHYLSPGGRMVAVFSATYSAFGVVNRLLPDRIAGVLAARIKGVNEHDVFPAHYDQCNHRSLTELLSPWAHAEIVPWYRGAVYFRSSRVLLKTYLAYEEWASRGHLNLATHYLISAEK